MMELGSVESAIMYGVPDSTDVCCGTCEHFAECGTAGTGPGREEYGVCRVKLEKYIEGKTEIFDVAKRERRGIGCPDWEEHG